jgi:formylglycine-generating enzyme required for sulfatase activity
MKRIILTTVALAVLFALPAHAGGKKHTAVAAQSASSIDMVHIAAGSFMMGGRLVEDEEQSGDEIPQHRVNLKAFEIGKYEVTQGQWKAVMGDNPSYFKDCGDTCPVENVSWNDVQVFIQKLNAQSGENYRLPSESEWEYACYTGKNSLFCGGNKPNAVAWYDENSGKKTHPVGRKQANARRLHDMSGNIKEWVQDYYHDTYANAPSNGSAWEEEGKSRVLRGGSWNTGFITSSGNSWSWTIYDPRAARRNDLDPSERRNDIGFRLARTLP